MDKLVKRVAAKYAFELALGSWQPSIPDWVEGLSEQVRVAWSYQVPEGLSVVKLDSDAFQDAKDSIAVLLPKFLQMLRLKYHDRYHMNATQRSTRMHYYFATKHPLETFVLDLNVKSGQTKMALHFIPHDMMGKPMLNKSVYVSDKVSDPELAGLTFMRLARKLLSKV